MKILILMALGVLCVIAAVVYEIKRRGAKKVDEDFEAVVAEADKVINAEPKPPTPPPAA